MKTILIILVLILVIAAAILYFRVLMRRSNEGKSVKVGKTAQRMMNMMDSNGKKKQ